MQINFPIDRRDTAFSTHAILIMAIVLAHSVICAEALDSATLLKLMKAKDEGFDNFELRYLVSAVHAVDPIPQLKFFKLAEGQEVKRTKPQILNVKYNEQLIARGIDTTVIRQLASCASSDPNFGMAIFQKSSNTKSLLRSISRHELGAGRGSSILDIDPGGLPVDLVQEQRMVIEFTHGIGLGKRIKSISEISRTGDIYTIKGDIQIWWEDKSTFEAEVDSQLLCRRATIDCDVRGNLTRFEFSTTGLAGDAAHHVAATGSIRRFAMGLREGDRKPTSAPLLKKEFVTEYREALFDLSDVYYEKAIAFNLEEGMQVMDHVLNMTYFVGKGKEIEVPKFDLKSLDAASPQQPTAVAPQIAVTAPAAAPFATEHGGIANEISHFNRLAYGA